MQLIPINKCLTFLFFFLATSHLYPRSIAYEQIAIGISPYALAYHLLKKPTGERELTTTEYTIIQRCLHDLRTKIAIPTKIMINDTIKEVVATKSYLICNTSLLDLAEKNPLLTRAFIIHACAHTHTKDYDSRTAMLLTIPTVTQTPAALIAFLAHRLTRQSPMQTIGRISASTSAMLVSIFTMLMYCRYQEICADIYLGYYPAEARAYADYLEQQAIPSGIMHTLYSISPIVYEICNTSPLCAKRAQWLRVFANKTEKLLLDGKPIIQKDPQQFLPAIWQLIRKKIHYYVSKKKIITYNQ